jgi:predicted ester cyclase
MTRDEVLAVVTKWQTALASRDVVTYVSLYSDTVELQSPLAGTVCGHDGLVKAFNAFFTAFPDATFVSEAPIIDGNRVVVASVVAGTDSGGLMGLAPSGKPFRFKIVFLLELDGSMIVRDRRNYDFTGLLVQLGVLKAKPA